MPSIFRTGKCQKKCEFVFKIHVNLNNELKRPLQQQGASSRKRNKITKLNNKIKDTNTNIHKQFSYIFVFFLDFIIFILNSFHNIISIYLCNQYMPILNSKCDSKQTQSLAVVDILPFKYYYVIKRNGKFNKAKQTENLIKPQI